MTWVNNSPLAYQLWRKGLMRDQNIKYTAKNLHYLISEKYCKKYSIQSMYLENASKYIQPMKKNNLSCTAMVLENLATPGWISVSCSDAVISEIVCVKENNITYKGVDITHVQKVHKVMLTVFLCPDGQSISSSRQCNGVADCADNADEANCFCFVKGRKVKNSYYCKYFCQHPACICHDLWFQDNYPGCHLFEQGKNEYFGYNVTFIKNLQYSECLDEPNIIDMERENGSISVCPDNTDKPVPYSLFSNKDWGVLSELSNKQRYCSQSSYFIKQQCIYEINEEGTLQTCRNGKHLENCTNFNCQNVSKYKCPGYYCIPMAYVCNGRIDCPRALDENDCNNYTCERLFHCFNTVICIYIDNICDGVKDCPHGDDEFNCILSEYTCPENCSCQILAISCKFIYDIFFGQLILLERMVYIFIIGNPFLTYFTWSLYLYKVRMFNLHNFKLPDVCSTFDQSFKNYSYLLTFDISKNQINILRSYCLHSQLNMAVFNISGNDITTIEELAFMYLKSLQVIDLSYNKIAFVNGRMFLGIGNIIFFRFYGNDLKTIDDVTFKHMILIKLIVTSNFRICCIKPCYNTICDITPKEPHICQGLITNNVIIIIMFVFAFVLTVINLISLHKVKAFNIQSIVQNTCFEIIAKYLHLSDLSCALYICLITAGNIHLKISTTAHAIYWRSHVVCYLSCILYTYFQMTSIGVILFMALAKWLVAKYPLTSRLKHISFITLSQIYFNNITYFFSLINSALYS